MENRKLFDPQNFAENFRELLFALELTQAEAARRIGVSAPLVNWWYNGQGTPDLHNLCLICNALEISPEWLLTKHVPLKYKPGRI